jgi:hypothetical protein
LYLAALEMVVWQQGREGKPIEELVLFQVGKGDKHKS